MRPDEILANAAETFKQRNEMYGDNYLSFGAVMQGMFPKGVTLRTIDQFNRFGIFVQCVSKMTRYSQNLVEHGGHQDSAHDLAVYAAMLESLTE